MKLKLLIIGHSEEDINQLSADFNNAGRRLTYQHANSWSDIQSALNTSSWDAIIAEYMTTEFDVTRILDLLKASNHAVPFIVYTSMTDEQTALSAMRNGANDYIPKGHSRRLMLAIDRELKHMDLKRRKRQADSHIYRMTYYDELTSLPKRNLFCEKAVSLLNSSIKNSEITATVYFIHVDRLPYINSMYGYETRDALIQQFASRLSAYSDKNCILTRIEGGKFAFFRTGPTSPQQTHIFINQLLKLVTVPFTINCLEFYITLNIGISIYPDNGGEIEVLLANAESALALTKRTSRSTYKFYTREVDDISLKK